MGRNFSSLVVAQLVSQVLALIVSITLARILGVDFYGIFVFAFAFPNSFLVLLNLGLDSVVTIRVAADHSKAAGDLTATMLLRIPLLLLTLVALWTSLAFMESDPTVRYVTFLLGSSSAFTALSGTFSTIFRAFERIEYVALMTIVGQVLTNGAVLVLLFMGFGLVPVASVYLVVSVLMTGVAMWLCHSKFTWFVRKVEQGLPTMLVREGLPFGLQAVISTWLFTAAPVLLTLLASPLETGIFNAAFGLTSALLFPFTLYYTAVLPAMSRFYAGARDKLGITLRKSHKLFFILGLPLSLGGLFYRETIVTLFYGSQFATSGTSFGILVLTLAVEAASVGVGTALAAAGRQVINLIIGSINVLLLVVLCFLLIPALGPSGAAAAYLASSLFGATGGMVMVHRLVSRVDLLATVARPAVAGGVMLAALFTLGIQHLGVGLIVGGGVYFGTLILVRGIGHDDWELIRQLARGAMFR